MLNIPLYRKYLAGAIYFPLNKHSTLLFFSRKYTINLSKLFSKVEMHKNALLKVIQFSKSPVIAYSQLLSKYPMWRLQGFLR